jgi:hypothetical protein
MAFFLRPLFMHLLLLCVMLNLGDAPYVDELMAEMSQDTAVAAQLANNATPSKSSQETVDQTKAKHSVYEDLLALVAMPMQEAPAVDVVEPRQSLPAMVVSLSLSAHPSSIEKPPRFVATA